MSRVVRAVVIVSAFVAALVAVALPADAGTAELLADIEQGSGSTGYGVSAPLIPVGNRVVFQAAEPSSGSELWASDGTYLGTRLLRDLAPGEDSTDFRWLGTVGKTAVLRRRLDRPYAFDLWRSDGTAAGTFSIASPGFEICNFQEDAPESVIAGDRLYFLADASGGCSLWKTDGTAAGTREIGSANAASVVAAGSRVFFFTPLGALWVSDGDRTSLVRTFDAFTPRNLTAVGSRVVFLAKAGGGGEKLWSSDGTAAGTRAVTEFFEPAPFGEGPLLTAIGNTLYFTADDGTGTDLWQTDASGATARRVTDFIARRPFGNSPLNLARLGDLLLLTAQEEGDREAGFWLSGGTPGSTRRLDGCPGGCPGVGFVPFVPFGNRVLFAGRDAGGKGELWVTDGTGAGTQRLGDLSFTPYALLGKVFFIGPGSHSGYALWKSDGTAAGTVRLAELGLRPFDGGLPFLSGFSPAAAGGRIFFAASLESGPSQLVVSDGTPTGTRAVSNIVAPPSSYPAGFAPFAGGALFSAQERGKAGLWRTDGTAAGTKRVRDAVDPRSITPASNGIALFLKSVGEQTEVWRTDGTEAGTFRIAPAAGTALDLARFGSGVVFGVLEEDQISLWESDGTVAGTHKLFDLPADLTWAGLFRVFGPQLYFVADLQTGNEQLWVSDGTPAGTQALISAEDPGEFPDAPPMAQVGGTIYFSSLYGLWKTDGTTAGTVQIFDQDGPTDLTEAQGALFFMAGVPESPNERGLWRTDGTAAGTALVKSVGVPLDDHGDNPVHMVRLGGLLVFLGGDSAHGVELWRSDGTAAGTVLVRDIAPGEVSSQPFFAVSLVAAGGKAYFSATDETSGFELWESDGTAAGTRRVQDIAPGALSSSPAELAAVGNRLYFAADDGVHGREPWALSLGSEGCVASAVALCLGGRFRVEADWQDFQGHSGRGGAVALTADTGTFWFFDAANAEVVLKVLDGRGANGHFWVFYGALSSVEYTLTVTDTQTGAVRRYFNPPGTLASVADTEAFGPRGATVPGVVTTGPAASAAPATIERKETQAAPAGSCVPSGERLCLNGGRFAVEAQWRRTGGSAGTGKAVPLAGGDTGYFWFFDAKNVEVVLKVLDGRPANGKFWVFYGALSNVDYTLTVTDTQTGAMKTYHNPNGRLASVADTGAF
ncbi:MAG TPA: ELWxxDGT repeat protein [Thermoanaerobaculia bacterium]|jgi:ELWxxDGT repeat protein|nr:ELWxxDGT repeat protein [Thermoanaerobaculia bacterium]